VRVADFGLSVMNASSNALRGVQGTAPYLAPELVEGDKYTSKSDIYSLAIILWEMIYRVVEGSGTRPYAEYKDLTSPLIIIQVASGLRPTMPEFTPLPLSTLVVSCWNGDYNVRPTIDQIQSTFSNIYSDYQHNASSWQGVVGRQTDLMKKVFMKKKG